MKFKIFIQPLGVVNDQLISVLKMGLSKRFNANVEVKESLEHDVSCFNFRRMQYNSTCLLRKLNPVRVTLGVTEEDIYANSMNFVFGEAELNGSRAIVSIFRLKSMDRQLVYDRLLKESIHEIGHVLGLRHCRNKTCVMSFSNSILEVDRKTSQFCELCKLQIAKYLKE